MSTESDQGAVNKTDIEWIKATLLRIEAQTTKTNGRVTIIELWKAKVVGMYTIAIGVFTVIVGFTSNYIIRLLTS